MSTANQPSLMLSSRSSWQTHVLVAPFVLTSAMFFNCFPGPPLYGPPLSPMYPFIEMLRTRDAPVRPRLKDLSAGHLKTLAECPIYWLNGETWLKTNVFV